MGEKFLYNNLFSRFCICLVLTYFFAFATAQMGTTITIGALVSSDTSIGKIAMQAIDVAVKSINQNTSILQGYQLVVKMLDTKCNPFEGAVDAAELLKQELVGILGPQSSFVSRFVAHMVGATQVPLISFAATDPTLSQHQYPYFFRTSHSDAQQMDAIAAFIKAYGWSQVICFYSEDEIGRHGVTSLRVSINKVDVNVVYEVPISPFLNTTTIEMLLKKVSNLECKVYVVHMPQNMSLSLLSQAKKLQMMIIGSVWIVSDSITGTLSSTVVDATVLGPLHNVVGIRSFYENDSSEFLKFISEWNSRSSPDNSVGLHIYGLYAYDATWLLAHALDNYLKQYGFNFTFHNNVYSTSTSTDLAQLRVFDQGPILKNNILKTQFKGASGYVQLNNDTGDLVRSKFEFVNIVGGQVRVIGFWSNLFELSITPPIDDHAIYTTSHNYPFQIIWPGNSSSNPRGWTLSSNGQPLSILIPKKLGFPQLINWPNNVTSSFQGFCIDVFTSALRFLPYTVPYKFILYGNETTPIYDEMIERIYDKTYDAIVGDFTITTKRMEKVDFTQPYVEAGLVVVVPLKDAHEIMAWNFLRPFTYSMWLTTLAFFVFTGIVVWLLEHKKNKEFRGPLSKQVVTTLWFIFSTLVFAQREATRSILGRFVVVIWLFVVLIITSSYTANLTTILTTRQLTGTISGISDLQESNVAIGYNKGSYVKDYLISLKIAENRLKPYNSMDDYIIAFKLGSHGGGIGAMVVGYPFAEAFLDLHCEFTTAGDEFTKAGWGFIFPKGSEFAIDMSIAIMKLAETGLMQRIHDLWLKNTECSDNRELASSSKLSIDRFWGLFLITGTTSFLSITIYLIRQVHQFIHKNDPTYKHYSFRTTLPGRTKSFIKSFASYMHEYAQEDTSLDEPSITHCESSNPPTTLPSITHSAPSNPPTTRPSITHSASSKSPTTSSSITHSASSKSMRDLLTRTISFTTPSTKYNYKHEFDEDPKGNEFEDFSVDNTLELVHQKSKRRIDKSPDLQSINESNEILARQ